jgi:hypothetical protein
MAPAPSNQLSSAAANVTENNPNVAGALDAVGPEQWTDVETPNLVISFADQSECRPEDPGSA